MAQKLICLLFALVGGIFSYFMLLGPVFEVVQARWWIPTVCVMTESEVISGNLNPRARSLQIGYRYVVENKEHESHRYSFLPDLFLSGEKIKKIVDRYSPGHESVCYVNPSNPGEAILNRNFSSGMLLGLLPPLLFVLGVGGLGVFPIWSSTHISDWINKQRARRRRVRGPVGTPMPTETPEPAEIHHGFWAALAFTGLGLFYLIAAIGDEFSNISYLGANVAILLVLTIGYRRRVVLCALALVAYAIILPVSDFAFQFSSDVPSQASLLILRFAPASLVPVLARGQDLPILFAAYVKEVAPALILVVPIAYFLFMGTRRLLSERPALAQAQVAIVGAVTAVLLLPVIAASVQVGMRRFIPESPKTPEATLSELQSPDAAARKRGCEAAMSLDPLPGNLVPVLIRATKEGDAESRGMCIAGLIHAGAAGKDAIPLLVTASRDASSYVRLVAAEALGTIGSKGRRYRGACRHTAARQ